MEAPGRKLKTVLYEFAINNFEPAPLKTNPLVWLWIYFTRVYGKIESIDTCRFEAVLNGITQILVFHRYNKKYQALRLVFFIIRKVVANS